MTDLFPTITYGDLELTSYPYAVVMDYDLGAGAVSYETLVSRLLDGELVFSDRTGNRELALTVVVEGPTLGDVADNAAALFRECEKRTNVLTIDPGDGFGAPTAFDTFRSAMVQSSKDLHEMNGVRTFDLTIPALPWARSVELTTQPAVDADATLTVIDDCSSATGWKTSDGSPVVSSGSLVFTESVGDSITGITRTGSVDLTDDPYLVVDWKTSVPAIIELYGDKNAEVLRTASPFGADWKRSYFYKPGTVSALGFLAFPLPVGATVSITQVAKAASVPDSDTAGHQQTLAVLPGGSARTQAQIEIVHDGTASLGEVTLYTSRLGQAYNPSLRRWLYDADEPDFPSPSGDVVSIAGPAGYDIPASTIIPGGYVIAARMMCSETAEVPIVYSAQTIMGSTPTGDYVEESPTIKFTADKWRTVPLGLVSLPTSRVGPGGTVRIGVQRGAIPGGVGEVYLQDVFLFHEDGDLTIVDCQLGTSAPGGPGRRLRVVPPSHDRPGGGLDIAHSSDWSDAYAAGAKATHRPARGHVLYPEGTSVFVMADGTPDNVPAEVSFQWYKRHHTHAVD